MQGVREIDVEYIEEGSIIAGIRCHRGHVPLKATSIFKSGSIARDSSRLIQIISRSLTVGITVSTGL
jgi:hypothetical protein